MELGPGSVEERFRADEVTNGKGPLFKLVLPSYNGTTVRGHTSSTVSRDFQQGHVKGKVLFKAFVREIHEHSKGRAARRCKFF